MASPLVDISYKDPIAVTELSLGLIDLMKRKQAKNLVVACIGTDRFTGDALGPLVGTKLKDLDLPNVFVFGTLEHPLHAANLQELLEDILLFAHLRKAPILAIDSCLGKLERVGQIMLSTGALLPGRGVGKQLPEIGDWKMMAIVNAGTDFNFDHFTLLALASTRLWNVVQMAEVIAEAVASAARYIEADELVGTVSD